MGSPGGYLPRLEGHCGHKLATSCMLTSTRQCCACKDQRTHSTTYSVYVDGAGLRPWGTRWINYCWPCKEYWDHRTGNGVLPSNITRIPSVPSQRRFLERWNWFYDRYWTLRDLPRADGSVSASTDPSINDSCYQEPWRDVDPGRLPRTREEVLSGADRSQYEMAIDAQQWNELLAEQHRTLGPTVDIDQALNQLLDIESSDDDEHNVPDDLHAEEDDEPMTDNAAAALLERSLGEQWQRQQQEIMQAPHIDSPLQAQTTSQTDQQPRLEPVLWGESQFQGYSEGAARMLQDFPRRLRSILSDDDESSSAPASVTSRNTSRGVAAAAQPVTGGVTDANHRLSSVSGSRTSAMLHNAADLHHALMDEMNLLDPDVDIEQLHFDTINAPLEILSLWTSRMQQLNEAAVGTLKLHEMASNTLRQFVRTWPTNLDPTFAQTVHLLAVCVGNYAGLPVNTMLRSLGRRQIDEPTRVGDGYDELQGCFTNDEQWINFIQISETQRLQRDRLQALIDIAERHLTFIRERGLLPFPTTYLVPQLDSTVLRPNKVGLDTTPRPKALKDEQMLVRMECGICLHQVADIACLPCGHVIMCEWCANVHMPLMPNAATALLSSGKPCPKCRKPVKQRVKLYL